MPDMERDLRKLEIRMAAEGRHKSMTEGEVRAYFRGIDRARWQSVAIFAVVFAVIAAYNILKG